MSEHLAQPWWKRLLTLEPALVRGLIGLIVAALLIWGIDLTDLGERVADTADILGQIVALLTPLWIRGAVTPAVQVVQSVEPDGTVIAGPASPLPTGTVISTGTAGVLGNPPSV